MNISVSSKDVQPCRYSDKDSGMAASSRPLTGGLLRHVSVLAHVWFSLYLGGFMGNSSDAKLMFDVFSSISDLVHSFANFYETLLTYP